MLHNHGSSGILYRQIALVSHTKKSIAIQFTQTDDESQKQNLRM